LLWHIVSAIIAIYGETKHSLICINFFPFCSHPLVQEELQNSPVMGEKADDLVKVLRELTAVQRKISDLEVELRGRKVPVLHVLCVQLTVVDLSV